MPDECAQLLKSVCALKGINQGEWIEKCVREHFTKLALEDKQVQQIVLSCTYPKGTPSYALKELILESTKE